jgi:hypothetical protein
VPDPRTVDHVVHAVDDLEEAAAGYADLGFTVTPRADHPFGTSNRLVVVGGSYTEVVAVTSPEHLPLTGFAARVAQHLLHQGAGITHVVLSSAHPETDVEALGSRATGEIFSFSRPAPQVEGAPITAEFDCVLVDAPSDLGMFLCHHRVPEAVWNPAAIAHRNGATAITSIRLPVEDASIADLAAVAHTPVTDGATRIGDIEVASGPPAIRFDVELAATTIAGVAVGGR